MANSSIETDLNIPPYFDDFDTDDRYYRYLFRPRTAVQARELTGIQTLVQSQIEKFGNHIFKDGSVVEGVPITYFPNVHYISVEDFFDSNTDSNVTDYDSTYLITNSQDSNNAVRAVIKIAKLGTKVNFPETNRLYLDYITTGTSDLDEDVNEFAPGDTLYFYSPVQGKYSNLNSNNIVDTIITLSSNDEFTSNGYSYCMSVGDGTIFQKGYFLKVEPHTIAVNAFTTNVHNHVVGFNTEEEIIDENDDINLNDNALGYPNENAPGSHRLKLIPTLIAKERSDAANNKHFFSIVEFDWNEPQVQKDEAVFDELGKALAERTYEESGDYIIKPFNVEPITHDTDSDNFYYQVSSGIAYVRGFRVEKLASTKVEAPRGIDTDISENQIVTANYGNYVVCDQLVGGIDVENLKEIGIYDTPQYSIAQGKGSTGAIVGNLIGYANVRAVMHENGNKGLGNTTYLLYLFNIRMNSGKSFSGNAKSFAFDSGTFDNFRADIVLNSSNAAELKENSRTAAIFDIGLTAIKRLTNNTGVGDTSFIYNQIKSGTVDASGSIALTIDSPASGGLERLNASVGAVLTGSSLDQYNFFIAANGYSSNIGTISITSGSAAITGTGFNATNDTNRMIRISANSTSHLIRTVVSVTNSTHLTVDSVLPQTNASAVYRHFYATGLPLPVANVVISTNTSFVASLPTGLDSGSETVYCSYPVNRTEAVAIPKQIIRSRFVKINCSNNAGGTTGPWNLGFTDVHKIKNVYVGTTYSPTNTNRITWFNLNNGQKNEYYDHAQLILNPIYKGKITSSSRILVELDYFTANTTTSVGFFSVDSYPIDDANTANTTAIQTIDIPKTHFGADLRNYIDFRPRKYNTSNSDATSNSGATENPAIANSSFMIPASGQYMVMPDYNFTCDLEYYLPRIDYLTLNGSGQFSVIKGVPSLNPRPPFFEGDQSIIAQASVPAYPSATKREADLYSNTQFTKLSIKTNKRYSMKDIGVIDQRVKRIEDYTVLNTLEQQAKDLTVSDANGLDRFKNGIFADPFNSHKIGNIGDIEYKIAIDPVKSQGRPFFEKEDLALKYHTANSVNIMQTGYLLTLPYVNELYITQRYATKYRSCSEAVWSWMGKLSLYPSFDFFRDEKAAPNVNAFVDLATPWEQFANSPFGTSYGDWRTIANLTNYMGVGFSGAYPGGTTYTSQLITTNAKLEEQVVRNLIASSSFSTVDLGSYVKDVSIQPYMRSKIVSFICTNMKPRTTLHAFFDDVNVDAHCAPGTVQQTDINTPASSGTEQNIVARTAAFGTPLVSDAKGYVVGVFRIPENTFRTGDRVFQLTNVSSLITGADAKLTSGKAIYTADNLTVTRGSSTLTLRNPVISSNYRVNNRTSFTTTVDSATTYYPYPPLPGFPPQSQDPIIVPTPSPTPTPTPTPPPDSPSPSPEYPPGEPPGDGGDGGGDDPLSQSFFISNIPVDVSGIFVSQVGLYFKEKDPDLGITVFICEMDNNNVPDGSKIIAKAYLPSGNVNTSENAATETIFTFETPVYLMKNTQYAFMVQPDANSPNYLVWIGETGGYDIATGEQVFSNPYSGIMFVSANKNSWTAIQKEDMKFKLYRARFTTTAGYATFKNENDDYFTIDEIVKANAEMSIWSGDQVYSVNATSNTPLTGGTRPYGVVQFYNADTGELWLDSSTGGFSNTTNPEIRFYRLPDPTTDTVNTTNHFASATIQTVDNLVYHAVVPKFNILQPTKTSINIGYKGTSTSNIRDTANNNIPNNLEFEYTDKERHLMSYSNEQVSLSNNKSSEFKLTFLSGSNYVSPVLDLSAKNALFIRNMINNDLTDEHTRYGSALSKYVSKKITLADGQEAEDIRVYITAYRPQQTDLAVYVKFKNGEDPGLFDDKVWSKLQYDLGGEYVYSSTATDTEFREYQFSVPTTNAVNTGAFANTSTGLITSLEGTIAISNNSNEITGTGTAFSTAVQAGDRLKIIANTYIAIRTVTSVTNNTLMTVDQGLQETNSAALSYVFDESGNDGIVEYTDTDGARYIGFKEFAIKIVLLSSNPVKVPLINDVRALALQI